MNNKRKYWSRTLFVYCSILLCIACTPSVQYDSDADKDGHSAPTPATTKVNRASIANLPFENTQDFTESVRGFIARVEDLTVLAKDGTPIWDMPAYDFIDFQGINGDAPASVHPSLWRQAALNNMHGLYKLQDGIYQLRNFDLANMTIIESDTGWIIVDPLTANETAQKALEFAQTHLGKKPIKAILFTHSHIDHFGGVDGILATMSQSEQDALKVIAPRGFMDEAVSENLIAGVAMSRRAGFMYGRQLSRSERGHVGSGLGKGPAFGTFSIVEPDIIIDDSNENLTIDGVPFIFQYAPGSEAPAEFTFYLPEHKAFCGAEIVSRTMHNLYTLRGAKVRDASRWSGFIEEAREQFEEAELYFGSHHWPVWGQENIQTFLVQQRDTYQYIHDQTVRLMNAGYTPNEIAEEIALPASLQTTFSNRGYYGTVKHNAKAVYQAYMGWFTANPAMLDPLPEEESAIRYVEAMGGVEAVVKRARRLFEEVNSVDSDQVLKEYRWIAQLLNNAVFADPNNAAAKSLLANTYDQLGYLAESAPWRDFYLTGAYELRHGAAQEGADPAMMKHILLQTPVHKFFKNMAVRVKGEEAADKNLTIKVNFTDLNEQYLLTLQNAVLRHKKADANTSADTTINITHGLFIALIVGEAGLQETLFGDELEIDGSRLDLVSFFSVLDKPDGKFNIVVP